MRDDPYYNRMILPITILSAFGLMFGLTVSDLDVLSDAIKIVLAAIVVLALIDGFLTKWACRD